MTYKFMHSFIVVVALVLSLASASGADERRLTTYEEGLLYKINQYRLDNGLNPLSIDEKLYGLAKSHSQYMNQGNSLSHDNFEERFRKSRRSHCIENVGWNYSSPEAQLNAWKSSKGHNANLLDAKIRFAGISKVGPHITFFACD